MAAVRLVKRSMPFMRKKGGRRRVLHKRLVGLAAAVVRADLNTTKAAVDEVFKDWQPK